MRKQHRSLAELHYSKAVSLFLNLKDAPCELLRTLLERVAFAEFAMAGERRRFQAAPSRRLLSFVHPLTVSSAGQSSSAAKIKSLTAALDVMMETRHAFQLIHTEMLEEQRQVRPGWCRSHIFSISLKKSYVLLTPIIKKLVFKITSLILKC